MLTKKIDLLQMELDSIRLGLEELRPPPEHHPEGSNPEGSMEASMLCFYGESAYFEFLYIPPLRMSDFEARGEVTEHFLDIMGEYVLRNDDRQSWDVVYDRLHTLAEIPVKCGVKYRFEE